MVAMTMIGARSSAGYGGTDSWQAWSEGRGGGVEFEVLRFQHGASGDTAYATQPKSVNTSTIFQMDLEVLNIWSTTMAPSS